MKDVKYSTYKKRNCSTKNFEENVGWDTTRLDMPQLQGRITQKKFEQHAIVCEFEDSDFPVNYVYGAGYSFFFRNTISSAVELISENPIQFENFFKTSNTCYDFFKDVQMVSISIILFKQLQLLFR